MSDEVTENENEGQEQETQTVSTIISKGLVEQVYEFTPDDLISGSEVGFGLYEVMLKTPGTYKRGEILMLDSDQYVKATAIGINSALSIVILSEDVTISENEYAQVMAYSSGRFMGSRVIIPYETENDSHDGLLDLIRPVLMRMKIYID